MCSFYNKNTKQHLLIIYYVQTLSFTGLLLNTHYYRPHFTDEKLRQKEIETYGKGMSEEGMIKSGQPR